MIRVCSANWDASRRFSSKSTVLLCALAALDCSFMFKFIRAWASFDVLVVSVSWDT